MQVLPAAITGLVLAQQVKGIINSLNGVIDNAGLQGNLVVVQSGRQISLAVDQFANTYSDLLQQTATITNTVVTQQLQTLQTAANDLNALASGQVQNINNTLGQVQTIVNACPGSNTPPQVTSRTYSYLPNGDVELKFVGSFFHAAQNAFIPKMNVAGSGNYSPISNTTNTLCYHVPGQALFPTHPYVQHVTLRVPFPLPKSWLSLSSSQQTATYTFRAYLLSSRPLAGRVTIHREITTNEVKTQNVEGKEYIQSSARHWGRNNHQGKGPNTNGHTIHHRDCSEQTRTRQYTENATPGWTITNGRVHTLCHRNNHYNISAPTIAPNSISVSIKTENVGHNKSGGVWFRIDRTEQKTVQKSTPLSPNVQNLHWAGSISDNNSGTWKVYFDKQDKSPVQQFTTPTHTPDITIGVMGTVLTISAPALQNIPF